MADDNKQTGPIQVYSGAADATTDVYADPVVTAEVTTDDDYETLPSWKNFCHGKMNYRSIRSKNSSYSYFAANGWYAAVAVNCFFGFLCVNGIISVGSVNSLFSIGSLNSFMSIGSVNSALSIGCSSGFFEVCLWPKQPPPGGIVCTNITNSTFFAKDTIAGISCTGGTYDFMDSNDGTTGEQCATGGGTWKAYTCEGIEFYLHKWAEKDGLDKDAQQQLINDWWAPKCCFENEK